MFDLHTPQTEQHMVIEPVPEIKDHLLVKREDFQSMLDALADLGYQTIGPRLRDGVVVYDEVQQVEDFPIGWTDEQDGGTYRVRRREDQSLFGYNLGPDSWKRYLHPPVVRLWQAARDNGNIELIPEENDTTRYAFFGVRACELHAIQIQDTVLTEGLYADSIYGGLRERCFIVAVNCGQAGDTCFCVSMETGPQVATGHDLALTEVLREGSHFFVVSVGTEAGAQVMARVPHRPATEDEVEMAECLVAKIARGMGRTLETTAIKTMLYENMEHPRWEQVAERCLSCANCTMVCPTCFCTTVEDVTNLSGTSAERWRKADSCFTVGFSYIHGGSVRATSQSRYRQWMIHKLASWEDQFGTSGCVGCGRCITWCPVGIDITEEAAAIRGADRAEAGR